MYILVLLIGAGVFILQFSNNEKHIPNEFYQVYLDNEKIGVIKSKDELNKYIKFSWRLKMFISIDAFRFFDKAAQSFLQYPTLDEKFTCQFSQFF